MRAPKKVIAAMAMATLIGGAVSPAFADETDFTIRVTDGKDTLQKTIKHDENTGPITEPIKENLKAKGDIKINGEFTRTVTNFPEISKDGRYLRVTMPISLDYEYNLDTDIMTSAEGKITNESYYAQNIGSKDNQVLNPQPVKMSFMGLETTTQNDDVEYVNAGDVGTVGKAQLPFELVITSNGKSGKKVKKISLASMQKENIDRNPIDSIEIGPESSLNLEIGKIGGRNINNPEAIQDGSASVGHKMKLQFEYVGE